MLPLLPLGEGTGMRALQILSLTLPSPQERVQIKTPRTYPGARGMMTLLYLADLQDFNIICAARGFHFYSFTYLAV